VGTGDPALVDAGILDEHGILLRRDAVLMGLDDDWLQRQRRAGVLVKVRHGAYVDAQRWHAATVEKRHDLVGRAVMKRYDDRIALSHQSMIIRLGGPSYGLDLRNVHVTNLYGHGDRTKAGIVHHRGSMRLGDVTRIDGHWASAPPRAAAETALLTSREAAVCVFDWVLRVEHATYDDLVVLVDPLMREWAGSVDLGARLALADRRRESVGETLTALVLGDHGFIVEPQWEVRRPDGRLAGRTDFVLHREKVVVEFDGKIKYGRLLKPGQTVGDVIHAERARELLLEELTGYRVLRVVWDDLASPGQLAERVVRLARSHTARAS
jgi:very-short-patch-repair endonuclease